MKFSRIHRCAGQQMVALGLKEPPAPSCKCRRECSLARATRMVENKEASWVVVSRTRGTTSEACPLCKKDTEVKNCSLCEGRGEVEVPRVWDKYNDDVCSGMTQRTPRVATVESEHIERAYANGELHAQDRIEQYGLAILEERIAMGIKQEHPIRREDGGLDEDWGRPPWIRLE